MSLKSENGWPLFCARLGHASQEYNGGGGGEAVVSTKNATSVYRSSVPLLSLDLLSFDTTVSRPMPTLCSFV